MSKTAITITTINVPEFLEPLCANIEKYGHSADTSIFIIADKKTPERACEYCEKTAAGHNISLEYLSIERQEKEFSQYPELLKLFPYNTPDRVILGGIYTYLKGFDRLIAVDDDNYSTEHDFVGFHKITGTEKEIPLFSNKFGWFNVHTSLIEENGIPFYPRGYPWKQRKTEAGIFNSSVKKVKVVVNQGLVLEDPDIDAISRLFHPIRATGMKSNIPVQFGLCPGVWSPFNYQNTSLCRELIPCYFRPWSTSRNADIWTAYLFNKMAGHFENVLTFGQPLVNQLRNPHDLWDDLDIELTNNKATDYLIEILRKIKPSGQNYFALLEDLLVHGLAEAENLQDIKKPEKEMIYNFFREYKNWCRIVKPLVERK